MYRDIIFFSNGDMIFKHISDISIYITLIHWFICGVWLRWINMSTARFKIKTRHGWFIWMYLWREPTVFRIVLMAFSFYLIKLLSWAELLRLQPLPGKPLVTALKAPPTGRESDCIFNKNKLSPATCFCCCSIFLFVFCSNSLGVGIIFFSFVWGGGGGTL